MADLSEQITSTAAAPKRTNVDGAEVEEHSLKDLVEADKHLAAKQAAAKPHRALRFAKLSPPGTS